MLPSLAIAVSLMAGSSGFEFFQPISPPRRCQVMAHRGQLHQVPQNSAAAIEHAVDDLIEWMEIDVRRSKDGHHILIHDAEVDHTTNGHGDVKNLRLVELQALDAGSWFAPRFAGTKILTLSEAFKLANGRINLCLDCKDVDPDRLAEEIRAAGLEPGRRFW